MINKWQIYNKYINKMIGIGTSNKNIAGVELLGDAVKCPTLDLGSGHNLVVWEIKPSVSSALTAQGLLGLLSLPLSLSLSLKNK